MALLFLTPDDTAQFSRSLRTEQVGKRLEFLARTDSTNDLALEAARAGAAHGTTFIADAQDRGRGRRGRQWQSPSGLSLLFSVLTRPDGIPPAEAGWIPLLAGLASLDGIRAASGLQAALKWPNDIVLPSSAAPGWRKLGGILCESALSESASSAYVVIGIGINVNHSPAELPQRVKAPPSSVRIETKRTVERTVLFAAMLESLETRFKQLANPKERPALKLAVESSLREWWTEDYILNVRPGVEEDGAELIQGRFQRLDDFGRLVLTDLRGNTVPLADAEIVEVK